MATAALLQACIGIVEEKFSFRGSALTMHAPPVYGEGDAPHQERLPERLLQHEPLGLQHELPAPVTVGCGAGLPFNGLRVVPPPLPCSRELCHQPHPLWRPAPDGAAAGSERRIRLKAYLCAKTQLFGCLLSRRSS